MALDAARDLALADGLRGVTIRAIAAKIGYSVGTLYNLFEDQDELILRLNATVLDALGERLRELPHSGAPEDRIRRMARVYLGFTHANANLWNLLFEHTLPADKPLPDWYAAKLDALLALLERALEPVVPTPSKREQRDAARILWASLHGISSLAVSGKLGLVSAKTAQEMADALIRDYVAGLSARVVGAA